MFDAFQLTIDYISENNQYDLHFIELWNSLHSSLWIEMIKIASFIVQVHLAVTKKNTEMSVTWVTFEEGLFSFSIWFFILSRLRSHRDMTDIPDCGSQSLSFPDFIISVAQLVDYREVYTSKWKSVTAKTTTYVCNVEVVYLNRNVDTVRNRHFSQQKW